MSVVISIVEKISLRTGTAVVLGAHYIRELYTFQGLFIFSNENALVCEPKHNEKM